MRTLEWLKTELLTAVSDLFRGLLRGTEEVVLDSLAYLVLLCYLMSRRLGFAFSRLEERVAHQAQAHRQAGHEMERRYGDFSALLGHLRSSRSDSRSGVTPEG